MRSSCCILFIISFVTIALADVPNDEVSEISYLCDVDVLRNLTSEVGATNGILRSGSDNLNTRMERVENDLHDMNTKIEHLLEGFNKMLSNKIYLPSSCSEALEAGKPSGVYRLHIPPYNLAPFDVYCMEDPDKGPAWTVIQRRQDGSVDFNRDWESYKNGFGNLTGEFWIGLDKIYAMTSYQSQSLWIKLGDFNNETSFAKYEKFAITGERGNYALSTLGSFSGTAGDSLRPHLNMMFSTKDRDNDNINIPNSSCATYYEAGWWFNQCLDSNLNGLFKTINIEGIRIAWNSWGDHKHLKYSHMAIRPIY